MAWTATPVADAAVADRDQMAVQPVSAPQLLDHARITQGRAPVADPPAGGTAATLEIALQRTAPTARALSIGLLVVVIAGLLAAMLAAALALAARSASRTRTRTAAVLRTMGLPARAKLGLVLWEATPGIALAVPAGVPPLG